MIHDQLNNVAKYNPQFWDDDELRSFFVARQPQLEQLLQALRKETGATPYQHHLLLGQRGSGKSTLLRRLALAIEDDVDLNQQWVPLLFPEEQYNINGLARFWLNCLDALGDQLDRRGASQAAQALDARVEQLSNADQETLYQELVNQAAQMQRKFVLLVDNADLVLSRIDDQDWTLREVLQSKSAPFLMIGASASMMESHFLYEAAFYDFFRIHTLTGLNLKETEDVLKALAERANAPVVSRIVDEDKARIAIMRQLSGGNPRTIVLLFNVLRTQNGGDVLSDLKTLLDEVTPLYKARVDELPIQSQQILDHLAMNWHPMLSGVLAEEVGLKANTVSSQLVRLCEQGLVEKVASDGKKQAYQLGERFFNIWYLMRASRRMRQKLLWLVQFLRIFYGPEQLQHHARGLLNTAAAQQPEYLMAVAQSLRSERRSSELCNAIEHEALSTLYQNSRSRTKLSSLLDLEGEDQHLKVSLNRLELVERINAMQGNDAIKDLLPELKKGLIRSLSLSNVDKQSFIAKAPTLTLHEAEQLCEVFNEECRRWEKFLGTSTDLLWRAMDCGMCTSVDDHEGLKTAGEKFGAHRLTAFAYVHQAEQENYNTSAARAEALYRQATAADPNFALPWCNLGNLLQNHLQRYEEAEQAYRKAIELDANDAFPWNGLGNLLQYHLQRYEEAEEAYRNAIAIDADHALPWSNLGNLLQEHLQRYEEAEEAFRKAIAIDANDARLWNGLGYLLQEHLQRYEEAEQAYRKAIAIDADYAVTWYNLGILLQDQLQRYEEAEQAYRKAIAIDANNTLLLLKLGYLLVKHLQRHEEAEQAYRKAIEIEPTRPGCLNALAWVLFIGNKELVEAKQHITAALENATTAETDFFHTAACIDIATGKTGLANTRLILKNSSEGFLERCWDDLLRLLGMHHHGGQTSAVLELLAELQLESRLLPLVNALKSLDSDNPRFLNMLAPEIREAAEPTAQRIKAYAEWWRRRQQGEEIPFNISSD